MSNGADILNGRGLLETIRLADRALELEKELERFRKTESVMNWAHACEKLQRMMQSDRMLQRCFSDDQRRGAAIREMAAELVARIVRDACEGITLQVAEDHLNRALHLRAVTMTARDYNMAIPVRDYVW